MPHDQSFLQPGTRVMLDGRPGTLVGFSTDMDNFHTFDIDLDSGARCWIEAGPQVDWRLEVMAAPVPAAPMFLQVGRTRYEVATFAQASAMFCEARDASGLGASVIPCADIVDECGSFIARVSYNGRVWADREGDRLLCEAVS